MYSSIFEQDYTENCEVVSRKEITSKLNEVQKEVFNIKTEMNELKNEMNEQVKSIKTQMEEMNDSLHKKIESLSNLQNLLVAFHNAENHDLHETKQEQNENSNANIDTINSLINLNERCLALESSQSSSNGRISALETFQESIQTIFRRIREINFSEDN